MFSSIARVVWFFSLWLLLWLPFAIPMALKLGWRPFQPSQLAQKLPLLATLYLLAPLALWLVSGDLQTAGLTQPPLRQLGELGLGLVVGSISLAALFWMQLWAGWLQAGERLTLSVSSALLLLALALWVGWIEELVFRGFIQNQLNQTLSTWAAAALGSLIFALLHGLWAGRTVLPELPGLWLMGMVLVLACQTVEGSLGLAWGLHSGWVWTIGSLDGAKLHASGRLPSWITGLNQQPLAGLMGLLFMLATAAGLWLVKPG